MTVFLSHRRWLPPTTTILTIPTDIPVLKKSVIITGTTIKTDMDIKSVPHVMETVVAVHATAMDSLKINYRVVTIPVRTATKKTGVTPVFAEGVPVQDRYTALDKIVSRHKKTGYRKFDLGAPHERKN